MNSYSLWLFSLLITPIKKLSACYTIYKTPHWIVSWFYVSSVSHYLYGTALQNKLNEEKVARQRSESTCQEKDRQMSMLSVDYRQMQQRLQKLEGEHRQESEKVTLTHFQHISL